MNRKLIVVLGMHRSGTSLLAAGLKALGAHIGNKTTFIDNENPKGYFENEDIVFFNQRLLEFLGGRWDNPLFSGKLALERIDDILLIPWFNEANGIFQENYSNIALSAIKDPRMCQLLYFWKKVFVAQGFSDKNTYYIHIARDPYEVALSQQKRRNANFELHALGEELTSTIALWLSLNYQSLYSSESGNHIQLLYQDLLNNTFDQLHRIKHFVNEEVPDKTLHEFCDEFVEKKLKRNISDKDSDKWLSIEFPVISEFYLLQKILSSKKSFSFADVDSFLSKIDHFTRSDKYLQDISKFLSKMLYERSNFINEIDTIKNKFDSERSNFINELDRLNKQLDLIMESSSWKITAPLRYFKSYLKRYL